MRMATAIVNTTASARRLIALAAVNAAGAGAAWAGALITMAANTGGGVVWCGPASHAGLPILFGHCVLRLPAAAFTLMSIGALARLARQSS